jgi:hypothetical protein
VPLQREMGALRGRGGAASVTAWWGGNTWKSAKSTLKVRKNTRSLYWKILVCVALCDNSNNATTCK